MKEDTSRKNPGSGRSKNDDFGAKNSSQAFLQFLKYIKSMSSNNNRGRDGNGGKNGGKSHSGNNPFMHLHIFRKLRLYTLSLFFSFLYLFIYDISKERQGVVGIKSKLCTRNTCLIPRLNPERIY